MKNIELFDKYTGQILACLLQEFPLKHWLEASQFTGIQIDENTLSQPYENEIFLATLEWLNDEGFIKRDMLNHQGARCILTHKALSALKSIPPTLKESKESKSYGELLIEFASKAGEQGFNAILNALLVKVL